MILMPDDDLKHMFREFKASVSAELADHRQMFREFKASVSADLADQHRRLDEFSDEVRTRIGTAETAIINEIRSLASRFDLRLGRIESRLGAIEGHR
jgi:hypothetical protein